MTLNALSESRLEGVNDALVNVVRCAIKRLPFSVMVVEGLRSKQRQADLYAQGRTKPGKVVTWTLRSKHLEGRAVDLAPFIDGAIDWSDGTKFDKINMAMMTSAAELGIEIRWGADWDGDGRPREKGETDSPHWELVP